MSSALLLIGTLGAIFLAVCAFPQAWHCYQTKSSSGISMAFLALWLSGEVLTAVYVVLAHEADVLLMLNYLSNIAAIAVILRYKFNK